MRWTLDQIRQLPPPAQPSPVSERYLFDLERQLRNQPQATTAASIDRSFLSMPKPSQPKPGSFLQMAG